MSRLSESRQVLSDRIFGSHKAQPSNSLGWARFAQVLAHMIQIPQRFSATDDTVS